MNKKTVKTIAFGVALYAVGIIFFLTSSPNNLPLPVLVAPFLYIFICGYLTLAFIFAKLMHNSSKSKVLAAIIAAGLTLLLLLSSLHQLTARDILIALGIAVILVWYMHKK